MHFAPARLGRAAAAIAAALALASVPGAASAHVELLSSSPGAGANLDTAPTQVILTFGGELDPSGSGFTLRDPHGEEVGSGEVDLEIADRNVISGPVTVAEPGVYTVEWSVLGVDGHEITGSFSFGYATDEAIPAGEGEGGHDSPDTAIRRTPLDAFTVTGLLLLALAGLTSIRRAIVG